MRDVDILDRLRRLPAHAGLFEEAGAPVGCELGEGEGGGEGGEGRGAVEGREDGGGGPVEAGADEVEEDGFGDGGGGRYRCHTYCGGDVEVENDIIAMV